MEEIISDAVLDIRGEICPFPLIMTKKQMDRMAGGEILKVVTDDLEAAGNIDAWTRKSGDRILQIKSEDNTFIIYLKKLE